MKIESGRGVQGEMLKCVVMMLSVVLWDVNVNAYVEPR
jgi:hypothetical protein